MSNESDKTLAINRLSTDGTFGDSDRGAIPDFQLSDIWTTSWTVDAIRQRAKALGKSFQPALEIQARLEQDLEKGALVLFSAQEVEAAIEDELIPRSMRNDLTELVSPEGANDIAVVILDRLPETEQVNSLKQWFVSNKSC